jgi:hypothetical protein
VSHDYDEFARRFSHMRDSFCSLVMIRMKDGYLRQCVL